MPLTLRHHAKTVPRHRVQLSSADMGISPKPSRPHMESQLQAEMLLSLRGEFAGSI